MDAPTLPAAIGLTLAQVARIEGVSPSTVWRWCRHGVHVGAACFRLPYLQRGRVIRLEPYAVREWAARVATARQEADAAGASCGELSARAAATPRKVQRRKGADGGGASRRSAAAERRARERLSRA